jgi:hypothetical protein
LFSLRLKVYAVEPPNCGACSAIREKNLIRAGILNFSIGDSAFSFHDNLCPFIRPFHVIHKQPNDVIAGPHAI